MDLVRKLTALFCLFFSATCSAAGFYLFEFTYGLGSPPYGDYSTMEGYIASVGGESWLDQRCKNYLSGSQYVSHYLTSVVMITCKRPCPSDQFVSNNVCVAACPDGTFPDSSTGVCSPPKTCSSGVHLTSPGATGSACHGGCLYVSYRRVGTTDTGFVSTGATCTAGPETPDVPEGTSEPGPTGSGPCPGGADTCPPDRGVCPKGTFAEEVAGQAICIANPPAPDAPASGASAPQTSGQTGETKTTTTTSQTTTNPDGSTTTTTTSTSSGSESKPNDMASFCSQAPNAAVCQDAGSWAGSCSGGFTCGGDAVQCAQARAAYDLSCSAKTDPTNATVQAGMAALGAGDQPGDHPGKNPQTVQFQANIDQTNPYGNSCPADFSLSVMGNSVPVPLSHACGVLQWMGYVAVAFALYAAARIAFGGVQGA